MIINLLGFIALCSSIAIILGGYSRLTTHEEKEDPMGEDREISRRGTERDTKAR